MNDIETLKIKAANLKGVLERYAKTDSYAEMVLRNMQIIFSDIEMGRITPPIENEFRWYFASTDSPLFEYSDLGEAAAQYSSALELWGNQRGRLK